ncbi:MAG: NAD(P)H-hydrate dehydratase [Gammaproteobacteria bacterium]|nr:NAD(P)H-hydrate dehydratase [Gammaproteobacteria bacterium]
MSNATTRLPRELYRAADVRRLDALAIEGHGIPGLTLMGRAGGAVFNTLMTRWPEARRVLVCCGSGNNGGDGYIVATLAQQRGLAVTVLAATDPARLQGDAASVWEDARAAGVPVVPWEGRLMDRPDVIVDALLGTGLDRAVEGTYAEVIDAINDAGAPRLAVDIPSGLHADSGRVLGRAVKADVTVSFIGLKQGLFTGDGPDHAGTVAYHDLEVPEDVRAAVAPAALRLGPGPGQPLMTSRPRNAHKGLFGHVLVVGGNTGMAGASRMAGVAALRAGAGLVSVATVPQAPAPPEPELMARGVAGARDLEPLLERATVVAVGPGLGTDDWGREMFEACLGAERPLVVDADALNLLAFEGGSRDDWVLTPHPGEAGRLLGTSAAAVQADRFAAVAELRRRYGGTVVLKGCGTLVAGPGLPVGVCTAGNPGMASGGMGDLLTGVIAGLMAQRLGAPEAARAGVWIHGAAGDRAARRGERGLVATDLLEGIREGVNGHGG